MKTADLLDIVRNQRNNLNMFHEIVLMKQRALIVNDIKAIEGAIIREEKLITAVDKGEKEKMEGIKLLKEKLNLNYDSLKTTDFLQKAGQFIDAKLKKEFEREIVVIERLVLDIQKVNEQNQFLINNARQFIRKIVEAVAKAGKQSILDRKI